jgi:tetratricopeptide (TPR) repeat protein
MTRPPERRGDGSSEERLPETDEPVGPPGGPEEDWEDLTPDFEAAERAEARRSRGGGRPAVPGRPRGLAVAMGVAAAVIVVAALLAYRAHHHRRAVREGLERARPLLALDTAASYREAADVLEPLARLDPREAGAVRAFALAMLFADYRDGGAEGQAETLLVEPLRADAVPLWASLAASALAFGRREAGDATTFAGRAGDDPVASLLLARTALAAGNGAAALEYAAAAARTAPAHAGALALEGDLLRRVARDPARALAAYQAALEVSPRHPRAAYGVAKLALAGRAPAATASPPLRAILDDLAGTPAPERARAALHLAALSLRAGDGGAARRILDDAKLEPRARAWAERAAAISAEAEGPYRAVQGAPPSIVSPSDDDVPVAPLVAAAPPPAPKPVAKAAPKATKRAGAKPSPKTTTKKTTHRR